MQKYCILANLCHCLTSILSFITESLPAERSSTRMTRSRMFSMITTLYRSVICHFFQFNKHKFLTPLLSHGTLKCLVTPSGITGLLYIRHCFPSFIQLMIINFVLADPKITRLSRFCCTKSNI
jgi:hypothetical protein